ncbi:hypothetical protein F4819DRAFT_504431 [Hypoxylon fuscum]|nr:hypothetical protein F4819DRAFT_504431 [Hypoxylon fuscum]
MATTTPADLMIFNRPEQLFQSVLKQVQDPGDHFRLAVTCRTMGTRLNQLIVEDVRRHRTHIEADNHPGMYKAIISWCFRSRQPLPILQSLVEIYATEFPAYLENVPRSRVATSAIAADYPPALSLLIQMGHTPPASVSGRRYMTQALTWHSTQVVIWLVMEGVDVVPYLYRLERRNMLRPNNLLWSFLEQYTDALDGFLPTEPEPEGQEPLLNQLFSLPEFLSNFMQGVSLEMNLFPVGFSLELDVGSLYQVNPFPFRNFSIALTDDPISPYEMLMKARRGLSLGS